MRRKQRLDGGQLRYIADQSSVLVVDDALTASSAGTGSCEATSQKFSVPWCLVNTYHPVCIGMPAVKSGRTSVDPRRRKEQMQCHHAAGSRAFV